MKTSLRRLFGATLCLMLCSGCVSTKQNVLGDNLSSIETQKIPGMVLDTDDTNRVLRSVVGTLQDFGFILTQSDPFFGLISGIAFPSDAAITVIVRPHGKNQTEVRANIRHHYRQVQDAEVYRRFFTALADSLSLTANLEIDDTQTETTPPTQTVDGQPPDK